MSAAKPSPEENLAATGCVAADWAFGCEPRSQPKPPDEHHRDLDAIAANVRRHSRVGKAPAMAHEEVTSLRARLWEAGYRPVPVKKIVRGDPKTGKAPLGDGWTERARRNPPAAVIEPPDSRALNTGIIADGLRAIDIDIDDPVIAANVRALAIKDFGKTICRTRAGSPRALMLYRAAEGEPSKRAIHGTEGRGRIEVLGRGQQFVAFGWHYSGARLSWPDGGPDATPVDQLPAVTEEQIGAFLTAAALLIGAEPPEVARATNAARPLAPIGTLDRYCEAALDSAVRAIIGAPDGAQALTLNREVFSIAGLVEGRGMPASLALRSLHWAASRMTSHDPRRPWQPRELEKKVAAAFQAGLCRPRERRHG